MKTEKVAKPARHCSNNFKDIAAISKACVIFVEHSDYRVIPNLNYMDKWPNTDGYVELQDCTNLIGRIDVQVKTLPKEHNNKFDCPVSVLAYAETISINPFILLLVNADDESMFWIHLSREFLSSSASNYAYNEETYRINIPSENVIKADHKEYISKWEKIILDYRSRVAEYHSLRELYMHLKQHQNEAIGLTGNALVPIHIGLDYINYFFSTIFTPIKKACYYNCWKIGIILTTFDVDRLGYALYPIFYNENDVQIKFLDEKTFIDLAGDNIPIIYHLDQNPLLNNPEHFALSACLQLFKNVVKKYQLQLPTHDVLMQEVLFGLISRFYHALGLELKDEYTFSELDYAFNTYLPLWVDAAIEYMVENCINDIMSEADCLARDGAGKRLDFYDPYFLSIQIINKSKVADIVEQRLEKKHQPCGRKINSTRYPLHLAYEYMSRSEIDKSVAIKRLYSPFDHDRCAKNGSYIYNLLTKEAFLHTFELIIKELPSVYDEFVQLNFGGESEDLLYFSNFDYAIVDYSLKSIYQDGEYPEVCIYYFDTEDNTPSKLSFCEDNSIRHEYASGKRMFEFDNTSYKAIGYSTFDARIIYDDFPLLNIIYSVMEEKLNKRIKN